MTEPGQLELPGLVEPGDSASEDRSDDGAATSRWRGVARAAVINGICTKHRTRVTPITRICLRCHHEQLQAAARGSRDHERPAAEARPRPRVPEPVPLDIDSYADYVQLILDSRTHTHATRVSSSAT